MYIYVDNAATTALSDVAINAMTDCMKNVYGNPSSLHSIGQKAAEALDGLPSHKLHCSVLAEEAVKAAVEDYYSKIKSKE